MRLNPLWGVLLLGGCALLRSTPSDLPDVPPLRLAPAQAAAGAFAQRLELDVQRSKLRLRFEALLEIDAASVRLVAFLAQQEAFRLAFDGETLTESRANWLPDGFQAQWVLDDLQLARWPEATIRASLPKGWTLRSAALRRELMFGEHFIATVTRHAGGSIVVERPGRGYRLRIDSMSLDVDGDD